MESLRFPIATDIAYWWWGCIALMVAVFAWINVFKRKDFRPGVRLMYIALALAWTGDSLNKLWFGTRRLLDFPPWMLDSLPVLFISLITITGAAIHLHTFRGFRAAVGFAILSFVVGSSIVFW